MIVIYFNALSDWLCKMFCFLTASGNPSIASLIVTSITYTHARINSIITFVTQLSDGGLQTPLHSVYSNHNFDKYRIILIVHEYIIFYKK